jgi:pyochelin synthetase
VSAAARARTAEPSPESFARDVWLTGGAVIDVEGVAADPALADRFAVYRQNMALLRAWEPEPADTPVAELRAGEDPAEPDRGAWPAVAPVADVSVLAGDHFQVFAGDNVRRVAAAIEGVTADDRT